MLLTACASGPQTEVDYVRITERFQGTAPCADCQGVATDLLLKRDALTGAPVDFYLHETRIDAPGGQRVNTSWGRWESHRDVTDFSRSLYVLLPEAGDRRLYQPDDSGNLRILDTNGQVLSDDEETATTLKRLTPQLNDSRKPFGND
ncbi:copper resistance protein NlpE N-terminal domain-containing protein [Salinicola aestuarinus]|uniref:copper resistance protein NlpE N-terminal domain-containing protein n=1 Tax=Salinicola aestuarinus TaxID=1949082 RepID=UPI001FD89913|nr:copper resistance protein NlpE N-terminal domain-containing protein [Salinicola aestuarinus]